MSRSKIVKISLIVGLLALIAITIYFISQNTSLLTFNISDSEIEENNFNQDISKKSDLAQLTTVLLKVDPSQKSGIFNDEIFLNIPEGFTISTYATGLVNPRFFDFNESGDLIVADKGTNKIMMLQDSDDDGVADQYYEVDSKLRNVHSVFFYKGDLYSGEEDRVVAYRDIQRDGSYSDKEVLIDDLPSGSSFNTGSGHVTRTVVIGPDEKLYVSIGSSCNVCEEEDDRRAAIVRYNLDGSGEELFATGLRNTVGFIFSEDVNGETIIYGTDNGRDRIGDDIPPDELNIIEEGKDYGWPYCYGNRIPNPEYPDREEYCMNKTQGTFVNLQAHSAALGIERQEDGSSFPEALDGELFVAYHGSWNRTVPTGYKVVRIDPATGETVNFITGWLGDDGDAWGRPVGVKFGPDGDLYVTDDKAGVVYRVSYSGTNSQVRNTGLMIFADKKDLMLSTR